MGAIGSIQWILQGRLPAFQERYNAASPLQGYLVLHTKVAAHLFARRRQTNETFRTATDKNTSHRVDAQLQGKEEVLLHHARWFTKEMEWPYTRALRRKKETPSQSHWMYIRLICQSSSPVRGSNSKMRWTLALMREPTLSDLVHEPTFSDLLHASELIHVGDSRGYRINCFTVRWSIMSCTEPIVIFKWFVSVAFVKWL
jgi:hypothetical protein